jgi:hypothetical protein
MRHIKIITSLLFVAMFFVSCMGDSPKSLQNEKNISKLKVGMNIDTVKKIMGQPEAIYIIPTSDSFYQFMYVSPHGLSDDYQLYIRRVDSTVVEIGYGE